MCSIWQNCWNRFSAFIRMIYPDEYQLQQDNNPKDCSNNIKRLLKFHDIYWWKPHQNLLCGELLGFPKTIPKEWPTNWQIQKNLWMGLKSFGTSQFQKCALSIYHIARKLGRWKVWRVWPIIHDFQPKTNQISTFN